MATQEPSFFMKPTKDQCKDTGFAIILVGLIVVRLADMYQLIPWLIVFTLLIMIKPTLLKPAAALWFGLSTLMGTVVSKILLSVIFFVLVTPMGLLRRLLGKDSLQLRQFKKNKETAFEVRDHAVCDQDLKHMF